MDHTEVIQYLLDNPDFFLDHPDCLTQLNLPRDQQVLSVKDVQLKSLRQQNRQLSDQIEDHILTVNQNDMIASDIYRWCGAVMAHQTQKAIVPNLVESFQSTFTHLQTILRLWQHPNPDVICTDPAIKDWVQTLCTPFLGAEILPAMKAWFAPTAKSFACVPLTDDQTDPIRHFGVLVFASPDPQHFNPQLNTYFLSVLGQLCVQALQPCQR